MGRILLLITRRGANWILSLVERGSEAAGMKDVTIPS